METSFNLFNMERWFDSGMRGLIEPVKLSEELGVDLVVVPEHLAMSTDIAQFERRYGKAPVNPYTEFMEPMVFLGALSSVTKTIKLGTCVLLAPLRPALVLAKQIATLDYLSGGRAYIGLGAGWQREEFEASNMPWEGRYDHLVEQVQAARELWSQTPAAYHGKFVNFDELNCLPFPAQGRDLTILLGIKGTDRNFERMIACGAGWMPMAIDIDAIEEPLREFQAACKAKGVKAADSQVLVMSDILTDSNGKPDLDRTLALAPRYKELGVTTLQFNPPHFCNDMKSFATFVEKVERAVKG